MASRNINNHDGRAQKYNYSNNSTVKKVHEGNGYYSQVKSTNIDTPETSSSKDKNLSSALRKQETQVIVTSGGYSNRNSLRSARSSNTDREPFKNTLFKMSTPSTKLPFEIDFDVTYHYDLLNNSEFFVHVVDQFFYCTLCAKKGRVQNDHTISRHTDSQFHLHKFWTLKSSLVNHTPSENSLQMNAIRVLLQRWYETNSLNQVAYLTRQDVIREFNELIQLTNRDCYCRPIGSQLTETSLINSDVNVELIHPNSELFEYDPRAKNSIHHELADPDAEYGNQINLHTLHYDLIPNAINTLYNSAEMIRSGYSQSNFQINCDLNDLNNKVPRLSLRHIPSQTNLEVVCYADVSYRLSELLRAYLMIDDRARILSILVKYWASICKIADPNLGTYPSDTFIILVVYYLQRTSPPVLPCLHELFSKNSKNEDIQASVDDKTKESVVNGIPKLIDDFPSALDLESQETLDQCDPVEEELDDEEDDETGNNDINEETIKNLNWSSSNSRDVSVLFIDFLKFMIDEFDNLANVISIRTLKNVSLPTKGWNTSLKAIENPIKPKINISRSIGTARTFTYIRTCFKYGYYYLTSIPFDRHLAIKKAPQPEPRDYIELYIDAKRLDFYAEMKQEAIDNKKEYNTISDMTRQRIFARDVEVVKKLLKKAKSSNRYEQVPSSIASCFREDLLRPKDEKSTIFCWLCRRIGHGRNECPKSILKNLMDDLNNYNIHLDVECNLDHALYQSFQQDLISPQISAQHNRIIEELETIINRALGIKCRLQLFGSTVNNLGSYDSDMDICMTIEGNLTGKGVDCVDVLQRVHDVFIEIDEINDLEPILSARVPILKFKYGRFDVDLSMYNQCAIYNTKLLRTYANIDERVPQLFYLVKRYAKNCGIADASRGSLSSYAWSLMVIHFLQRTQPPILPVLQETNRKDTNLVYGVNGWNVWFQKNPPSLPPNQQTLTQLFKSFFLYYGNYEFNLNVVSIRTSRTLTKYQKNWHNCMMAIEDPFELTYNLSSRLDDPMAIYIINSFTDAYRNIVNVQEECYQNRNYNTKEIVSKIFKNSFALTGSSPPYRGCRLCHRIGHRIKDCPEEKKRVRSNQGNKWNQSNTRQTKLN